MRFGLDGGVGTNGGGAGSVKEGAKFGCDNDEYTCSKTHRPSQARSQEARTGRLADTGALRAGEHILKAAMCVIKA